MGKLCAINSQSSGEIDIHVLACLSWASPGIGGGDFNVETRSKMSQNDFSGTVQGMTAQSFWQPLTGDWVGVVSPHKAAADRYVPVVLFNQSEHCLYMYGS